MNDFYDENDLRKMGFKSVGSDVRVSKLAVIRYPEETTIGNHVAIDPFVFISVRADIGSYVHISVHSKVTGNKESYLKMSDYSGLSAGVTIICSSEDYKGPLTNPMIPMKYRSIVRGSVILEKYVVIGADVTIMPNVTIGEGTAVGAKALVTKSLDPWGIYIGIPAKRIADKRKDLIESAVKEIEGRT
jgi:galactoside O-acetyltransferase